MRDRAVRRSIEDAERKYDLNRAAELTHGSPRSREMPARGGREERDGRTTGSREEVTAREIAEVA
jgi:ATP-dependent Clp protease ATP-binding subunit ClpB